MKKLKSPFISIDSISENNTDSAKDKNNFCKQTVDNFDNNFYEHSFFEHSLKNEYIMPDDLISNLKEWKEKVYSIAILLTGNDEDAYSIADQVMDSLSEYNFTNQDYNLEKFEQKVRKLTYDASVARLLTQVKTKTEELEDTSSNILEEPSYLN